MIKKLLSLFKEWQKNRKKIKCCGHANPPQARFCGGCGLPLQVSKIGKKWMVALPLMTFTLTAVLTFGTLLLTSQEVSAADGFRDIPLDHPVYELTANLLRINAINTRSGGSFEPYEQILPEEWNYCIDGLETFLGFDLPADCRFREFDNVDSLTLQDKGHLLAVFLGWDEPEFRTGITRVEAFNMVEQIYFGGRLP